MSERRLLLIALTLVVAACGGTSATSSGELGACEWNGFPNWAEEPVNGVNLRFDQTEYRAGELATFRWEIDEGVDAIVGDESVVTCFDGQENLIAWQANGIFGDDPSFTLPSEGLGGDDDGWDLVAGVVAIPPDAPMGFYTAVIEGVVFSPEGESLGVSEFDGSFIIVN